MKIDRFIAQMADQAQQIRALAEGVSDEQAHWKPTPESWSIVEVLNHLRDVQQEDFRVFLDLILHRPGERRPKIAPSAWITERRYNERSLDESRAGFAAAREAS